MGMDQFERLLRFAQRTGDRLIVTDPQGREPIVIMSLDEYEALLHGAFGPSKAFAVPDVEEDEHFAEAEEPEEIFVPEFTPPLEVIDSGVGDGLETKSVQPAPRFDTKVSQQSKPSAQGTPKPPSWAKTARQEPSEEQFYLEPL